MATVFPKHAGATAPVIDSFYPSRARTCAGDSSYLYFHVTGTVRHLYIGTPYGRFESTDTSAPFALGSNYFHLLLPYWYIPVSFTLTAVGPMGDSDLRSLTIYMYNCDTPTFAASGVSKDTACTGDPDSVTVWWDPVREVREYLILGTDTIRYHDTLYKVRRTTPGSVSVTIMLVGTISPGPFVRCDGDTISITKTVFFKSCSGTNVHDAPARAADVTIYPVPASDELIITSDHLGSAITLIDVNGRTVQRMMLDALQQQKVTLDVSNELPGVYVIRGDTFTRTVLIAR